MVPADVYMHGSRINPSRMTDSALLKTWQEFNDQWRAAIAAGANPLGSMSMAALIVGPDKLAHIYDKHGEDFGLSGPKSKEKLSALGDALEQHVADPDTSLVQGKYRGEDANIFVNSRTSNAVVTDKAGNVVAGFKLRLCAGTQFDPKIVEVFLSIPENHWIELRGNLGSPFGLTHLRNLSMS